MDFSNLDKNQKIQIIDQSTVSTTSNIQSGMDYQGIEWETIMPGLGRKFYRRQRHLRLKPLQSTFKTFPRKEKLPNNSIYNFSKYYRQLPMFIAHFQLRHNLACVSKYDFIHAKPSGFYKFSTLDYSVKNYEYPEEFIPICLSYANGYAVSGGIRGELAIYDLQEEKVRHFGKATDNNQYLNCTKIYNDEGQLKLITGANDWCVRIYSMKYLTEPLFCQKMGAPVNNCSVSPTNMSIIAVCGDQKEIEILDVRTNKVALKLYGHEDDNFASDWHPNGVFLATGSQDLTCRVWDIRKPLEEYHTLQSEIASVSNVKFVAGGQFLVFSEGVDYLSIYDFQKECEVYQRVDAFGDVTGMDVDPEANGTLFFGMRLKDYEGVFEYSLGKRSTKKLLEESFL